MSEQGSLFDPMLPPLTDPAEDRPAPAHVDGPDTEHNAAELVRPRAGTLRLTALEALTEVYPNGLTDQELAQATEVYLYTIAPRRVELVRDGWVTDSGDRRMGERNRPAVVWRLTARGAAAVETREAS
jgi:hypothetical protein